MILRELRVCDFLVFPGEQRIALPSEEDCNIVVVLAPNNTGKTSIIRALKFLLYGQISGASKSEAHKMINDAAKHRAEVGDEVCGWVEATIIVNGEDLCLRRSVTASRESGARWETTDLSLARVHRGANLRLNADEDGVWERKFKSLVPESLFDAFYFKGEPLDGKLLGGVGAIRESLASFLHEDRWDAAADAAEQIRQDYTRELAKVAEKNHEYRDLLEREESARSFLQSQQTLLVKTSEELKKAEADSLRFSDEIRSIAPPPGAPNISDLLRKAHADAAQASQAYDRANAEIIRTVGSSKGIPFVRRAVPVARRVIDELRKDNILPADVSEGFVERVLKSRTCICGKPHDDESRHNWVAYKDKTLSVDLNRGLISRAFFQTLENVLTAVFNHWNLQPA